MLNILAIVGPTAVGKSKISIEVADYIRGEIISADSVQVYKRLNIGSAKVKPEEQYALSGNKIPHHMIDLVEPDEDFSVADYKKQVGQLLPKIRGRNNIPLLVGGTGLYVQSIVDPYHFEVVPTDWKFREKLHQEAKDFGNEYVHSKLFQVDPITANKLHPNDLRRIIRALEVFEKTGHPIWYNHFQKHTNYINSTNLVGLTMPRHLLYEQIEKRVDIMIATGFIDEVKELLDSGFGQNLPSMQSLGYKQIVSYLVGEITLEQAIHLIKRDTRRFAKRQLTWFRRDKRIKWYVVGDATDKKKLTQEIATEFGRSIGT